MPLEFTHVAGPPAQSQVSSPSIFDVRRAGKRIAAVEHAGFNRIVVDDAGGLLTNMELAAEAVRSTNTLDIALTHWAGDIEPAVAARQLATLDAVSGGRLTVRIVTGAIAAGTDPASHVETLQRTDEYLVLLKRLWANGAPIDHEGPAYSVRDGFVPRKGPRGADIPVSMNGLSGTAFRVAGRHADMFELPHAAPDQLRHVIERVRAAAAERGRSTRMRFALPLRFRRWGLGGRGEDEIDSALLAGSAERLALALLPYFGLGISELMIRDLDTLDEIAAFGRHVAPILRNSAVRCDSPGAAWSGNRTYSALSNHVSTLKLTHH